jgi:hypothetical protein
MKKIIIYIALLVLGFAACEPIEERDTLSGEVSVDQLEITAEPVVVDGKNTNEVIVENNSPILSRWISDRSQIESSYATVVFDKVGSHNVEFVGLNGNGTKVETTLPVTVDTMTNLPSEVAARLGIDDDPTTLPNYWGAGGYDYTVSVEQEIAVNGKGGNKLTLFCDAPYLCEWTFGGAAANKNSAELFITDRGTFTLSLDFTKADGTVIEDAYTEEIEVEELTTVPDTYINLFGDFLSNPDVTKTWQWSRSGKVWANGPLRGFTDPGAGWWQNAYADMVSRQDGTMTFKYGDMTLTKEVYEGSDTSIDPVGTHTGSLSIDLGTSVAGYSIGVLKLDGVTILNGVDVNDGNAPFTELSIVSVTGNTLILGGDSDGTGQTWLYKFEAVTE